MYHHSWCFCYDRFLDFHPVASRLAIKSWFEVPCSWYSLLNLNSWELSLICSISCPSAWTWRSCCDNMRSGLSLQRSRSPLDDCQYHSVPTWCDLSEMMEFDQTWPMNTTFEGWCWRCRCRWELCFPSTCRYYRFDLRKEQAINDRSITGVNGPL